MKSLFSGPLTFVATRSAFSKLKNRLIHGRFSRTLALTVGLTSGLTLAVLDSGAVHADQRVVLKSGLTLQGLMDKIASLDHNAFSLGGQGQVKTRPILLVDDGLRRTYVHYRGMVAGEPKDVRGIERTLTFKQDVPLGGSDVQSIGDILDVDEFNSFGRRWITVRGPQGNPLDILQGITELNARYAKVEALKGKPSYEWDMRISTKSIQQEKLQQIFRQRLDQENIDERLKAVRFFIEAERYRAAEEELARIIRDFPEEAEMKAQLISIVENQAMQVIDEAKQRASVGQEQHARQVFERFPMAAVGMTKRIEIKDELKRLNDLEQQRDELIAALRTDVSKLPPENQQALAAILDEIESGLSSATLPRLSDYVRLKESATTALESRVALAIAGWLLGPASGEQNLTVVQSLIKVRNLVAEYLGPVDAVRRAKILDELRTLEGAQVEYIDKLIRYLKPPQSFPDGSESENIPGFHAMGSLGPDADQNQVIETPSYLIQLPPEYDPLREYPCIVALCSPTSRPLAEMIWWAGDYSPVLNGRSGHAMRNGFIVICPKWSRAGQRSYEYTPREHHAVLSTLRHAMRRASIDADRVFLVGHNEGATAAWDIALSHPEHWTGMVSINGEPSKTIQHYESNARHVPMYFVMGESSGPKPPLVRMGTVLDDYMHVRNDAMVVMYKGRGREDFYEEITDIFRWMTVATRIRQPIPQEFEVATMRTGDQYFWWLEVGPLKPLVDINPLLWDQTKRIVDAEVSGSIGQGNQIRISGPSETFTVLLRPEIGVDLNDQIVIRYGSRPTRHEFDGEIETILEDTRQRADRKRPFWTKVNVP